MGWPKKEYNRIYVLILDPNSIAKTTYECNQENHVLPSKYNDNVVEHNVHVVPYLEILLNKKNKNCNTGGEYEYAKLFVKLWD